MLLLTFPPDFQSFPSSPTLRASGYPQLRVCEPPDSSRVEFKAPLLTDKLLYGLKPARETSSRLSPLQQEAFSLPAPCPGKPPSLPSAAALWLRAPRSLRLAREEYCKARLCTSTYGELTNGDSCELGD